MSLFLSIGAVKSEPWISLSSAVPMHMRPKTFNFISNEISTDHPSAPRCPTTENKSARSPRTQTKGTFPQIDVTPGLPGIWWRCPVERPWTAMYTVQVICTRTRRQCHAMGWSEKASDPPQTPQKGKKKTWKARICWGKEGHNHAHCSFTKN